MVLVMGNLLTFKWPHWLINICIHVQIKPCQLPCLDVTWYLSVRTGEKEPACHFLSKMAIIAVIYIIASANQVCVLVQMLLAFSIYSMEVKFCFTSDKYKSFWLCNELKWLYCAILAYVEMKGQLFSLQGNSEAGQGRCATVYKWSPVVQSNANLWLYMAMTWWNQEFS